jgi:cytochrome d ubiquinol oxidase subunit I
LDAVTLSRLQFGTTIIYHYLFVPLTMGLVVLIAIMETLYVHSGNAVYKRMAQFWGKLFLINFSLGVVTGIVQEFQFGMNWSAYSRFVGDVFGAPLAIEALLAFFMESTFLGIWIFGWQQLPKRVHLAMIWLVALGSHLSAFWILVANSFMQQPLGYAIRNGRAEMTDFLAQITNPRLWVQFPHVVAGGLLTGAFFVVGISAYHFLKKSSDQDFFRRSMYIGMSAALVGSLMVIFTGHRQAQYAIQNQPMKMAAAEALWNSENPASISLLTISNEQTKSEVFAIKIPYVLSFLAHDSFTGEVKGINQLQAAYEKKYGPGNYVPPIFFTYWGFRLMVGTGIVMALLSLIGSLLLWKKRLHQHRKFLWVLVASLALPYLANTAGWILTEVGRQPWLVSGLMKTVDGISTALSPGMVLFTLISFILLYAMLAIVDGFLLCKFARLGVQAAEESAERKEEAVVVTY